MMRVMSVALSPFKPGLSRQMAGGAWMASTDQRVDVTGLLERYPIKLKRFGDVARELANSAG
jgi:hypothetical protein